MLLCLLPDKATRTVSMAQYHFHRLERSRYHNRIGIIIVISLVTETTLDIKRISTRYKAQPRRGYVDEYKYRRSRESRRHRQFFPEWFQIQIRIPPRMKKTSPFVLESPNIRILTNSIQTTWYTGMSQAVAVSLKALS